MKHQACAVYEVPMIISKTMKPMYVSGRASSSELLSYVEMGAVHSPLS